MPIDEDRQNLLALMYDTEDDGADVGAPVRKEERPGGILSMPALTSLVRQQATTIQAQERMIKRLEQRVRVLERSMATVARGINDLDAEMGTKIDRRDW